MHHLPSGRIGGTALSPHGSTSFRRARDLRSGRAVARACDAGAHAGRTRVRHEEETWLFPAW
ncbi:hypothetical protein HMPREF0762_00642 [Slackia exigua ATCC 700122]|uniref:Uncharacterized protein n=1 Tax=Slackia exigua (strain ATCC 700122 / DSM 15923 / CIP 105133 / JCM 11022 / KCTC 5966 / S-7) TaxID=649764 RepID=D0WFP3_SLAES|nr:hypothetical protein HMPREF0762_00642 [Slackia exigua ATCC 700122]